MKTNLLKAILATILLACGLSKASAAIDPSASADTNISHAENFGGIPCTTACAIGGNHQ